LKPSAIIAVIITGFLLMFAMHDIPDWGSAHSPANSSRLSTHYITESYHETHVPNLVTSVLADYRGYDTMFETAVVFTAGIAILAILGVPGAIRPPRREEIKPDIVIQTACRILIPVIQIFALYVIAHGHISPGGGFQGGVIFGASLILLALAYDLPEAMKRLSQKKAITLAVVGVLIYAGIGVLCMLLGGEFLNYHALVELIPQLGIKDRYYGMLGVEIGVGLTVASVMFLIYAALSSAGDMEEGL
jgi:multicomponent Na+:H+ antiporter subunit B